MQSTEPTIATVFDFPGAAGSIGSIQCPQCGFQCAEYDISRATEKFSWIYITCNKCGFRASWEPLCDPDGNHCGWTHDMQKGAGVLHYRSVGVNGMFFIEPLDKAAKAAEAGDFLRRGFENGEIDPNFSCLTKWNDDTGQVEMVIGEFPELGEFCWYA